MTLHQVTAAAGMVTVTASMTTFWTPTADGLAVFSAFLGQMQQRRRVNAYAFTVPDFAQKNAAAFKAGKDIKIILDQSQETSTRSHVCLKIMLDAGMKLGTHIVVGTSVKHGLQHQKSTTQDGRFVENGSWNYSLSADNEQNTIELVDSSDLTAAYDAQFDALFAWIVANEDQAPIRKAIYGAP